MINIFGWFKKPDPPAPKKQVEQIEETNGLKRKLLLIHRGILGTEILTDGDYRVILHAMNTQESAGHLAWWVILPALDDAMLHIDARQATIRWSYLQSLKDDGIPLPENMDKSK